MNTGYTARFPIVMGVESYCCRENEEEMRRGNKKSRLEPGQSILPAAIRFFALDIAGGSGGIGFLALTGDIANNTIGHTQGHHSRRNNRSWCDDGSRPHHGSGSDIGPI